MRAGRMCGARPLLMPNERPPSPVRISPCIDGGEGVASAALTPTTRNGPLDSGRFPRKARQDGVSLTGSYTTHHPEGKLAVRQRFPASVASAPRGGVACNDAAIRRDQPMIGWVRDARVRSQERQPKGSDD